MYYKTRFNFFNIFLGSMIIVLGVFSYWFMAILEMLENTLVVAIILSPIGLWIIIVAVFSSGKVIECNETMISFAKQNFRWEAITEAREEIIHRSMDCLGKKRTLRIVQKLVLISGMEMIIISNEHLQHNEYEELKEKIQKKISLTIVQKEE